MPFFFERKKDIRPALTGIEMSATTAEGGHDYDDILGFPGAGFQDKNTVDPTESSEPAVESGDAEMNETAPTSGPSSAKKHKTIAVVPPDDFVEDRIKVLKKTIGGCKRVDNEWTEMLRGKLYQDTVKDKFAGDRTFKNNHQWVTTTPTDTRDGSPKWSWFGVRLDQNQVSHYCQGETIIICTTLDMTEKNNRFPSKCTSRMFAWFNQHHFVGQKGLVVIVSTDIMCVKIQECRDKIIGTRNLNRMLGAEGQLFEHPMVVGRFNGDNSQFFMT